MKKYSALFLVLFLTAVFMTGCNDRTSHFLQLNFQYYYDEAADTFIKYMSGIDYTDREFFQLNNNRAKYYDYSVITIENLPARMQYTDRDSFINIDLAYAIVNDIIVIASVPDLRFSYDCMTLPDTSDTIIVFANYDNAYYYNLNDGSLTKVFNDDGIRPYILMEVGSWGEAKPSKLIWVKIVAMSPDGKYILFASNRDNMRTTPESLDLYALETATGKETKLFSFDNCKLIDFDKSDGSSILYRERLAPKGDGSIQYSPVYKFSIPDMTRSVFYTPLQNNYQVVNGEYVCYLDEYRYLTLADIYSEKTVVLDLAEFVYVEDIIMDIEGKYLAYMRSYREMVSMGDFELPFISTALETVSIADNKIVTLYDTDFYDLNSYCWVKDSILLVNFQDLTSENEGASRFISMSRLYK